jgi:hypothetical protein
VSDAIPIACTLSAPEMGARLDEWSRALRRTALAVERPLPERLHFVLRDDPAAVAELLVLARAEKECCPFFEFACEIGVDAVRLVVGVPPDAVTVLDGFAALATAD